MMIRTTIPKNASGIYQIRSVINGKRYIGSSINIEKRLHGHFKALKKGVHENIYLQRTWNKYGEFNFKCALLKLCNKKDLLFFEQQFLDNLTKYDFNICEIAGSRLGTKFSESSKRKLSISCKGKSAWNKGISPSDDVRKKISKALRGRFKGENSPSYGRIISEESRKKISESQIGRIGWSKGLTKETDERIKKISEAGKGKEISEETKMKIRDKLIGKRPSKETRMKLSLAQKRRWSNLEAREKQSKTIKRVSGMRGKYHTEEVKKRMSESHRITIERKKRELCLA